MTALTRIRLRTLGWCVCFPVTFLGFVPWWLHRRLEGPLAWEGSFQQWIGLWLILNGLGLAGWCVNLFNVQGRGTPVPFDPPARFVASGPYRVVRNPMVIGLLLFLLGEAALYQSRAVAVYFLAVMSLAAAFVRWVEEPDLERRFGPPYLAYKRQVPRWVPRPVSRDGRGGPRQF